MAVEKVEMQEATCDGCGKVDHWPTFEPVFGLHISWAEVSGSGGTGGKLFVCNERCAAKALKRRHEIEQEREEASRQ